MNDKATKIGLYKDCHRFWLKIQLYPQGIYGGKYIPAIEIKVYLVKPRFWNWLTTPKKEYLVYKYARKLNISSFSDKYDNTCNLKAHKLYNIHRVWDIEWLQEDILGEVHSAMKAITTEKEIVMIDCSEETKELMP